MQVESLAYQYVWDTLGRLTEVKDGQGTTLSSYTYDALDRLRDVTSAGSTIRHRYVGTTTQVSQFYNITSGANVRKFVTTWSGKTIARFTTTTTGRRYFGRNGHGDITWTTSGSGAVDRSVRYDPWGDAIAAPSGQFDFGFQGSWRDPATGLSWVVTRWYAPNLGAFISEDELLGQPKNPRSRHLYAYGWGDPVGMWDPDGRQSQADIDGVWAAIDRWGHGTGGTAAWDALLASHWATETSKKIRKNMGWKNRWIKGKPGYGVPGRDDAVKHCMWAGAMTCFIGAKFAKHFLWHHENGNSVASDYDKRNQWMDWHNNVVGVWIGRTVRWQVGPSGWVRAEQIVQAYARIKNRCKWAVRNGGLIWMRYNPPHYLVNGKGLVWKGVPKKWQYSQAFWKKVWGVKGG